MPFMLDFSAAYDTAPPPGVRPLTAQVIQALHNNTLLPSERTRRPPNFYSVDPFSSDSEECSSRKRKKKKQPKPIPVLARRRVDREDPHIDVPRFGTDDYLQRSGTRHAYDDGGIEGGFAAETLSQEGSEELQPRPVGVGEAIDFMHDEEHLQEDDEGPAHDTFYELDEVNESCSELLGEFDEWCFMCIFGNRRYDKVSSPKANKLAELYEQNFGAITNKALAAIMYKYYFWEIYQHGLETGKRYPKWSAKGVFTHITVHMAQEPRVWISLEIENLQRLIRLMDQFILVENPKTGVRSLEPRLLMARNRAVSQLLQLYKTNAKTCHGFNDTLKINPKNVAKFFHISNVAIGE